MDPETEDIAQEVVTLGDPAEDIISRRSEVSRVRVG
jgi:hypothetical protein